MSKVDEALSARLVQLDRITLFYKLADDLALIVLNNQDFLGETIFSIMTCRRCESTSEYLCLRKG